MSERIENFVIFVTFLTFTTLTANAENRSVSVLTRDGVPIAGPAARYGDMFKADTGVTFNIRQHPYHRLYDDIMIDFVTGQMSADVLLIPSAWLPDFAPYLSPMPDALLNSDVVKDIHPTYRDALMKWENQWMALTIDGDMHMGIYRRDLFADMNNRKAFWERYGRGLAPPKTWTEYLQIATFFSEQTNSRGKPLAGTLEPFSQGGQRLWYLFSHGASYINHPDFPGRMFFDPETMKPTITDPPWQRALEEYIQVANTIGGDVSSIDSYQVRAKFSRGEAAMAIDWTDIGVLAASRENSVVTKDIGFFVLPGSQEVWHPQRQQWETLSSPRSVPFLAFGGWIGAVTKSSPHPDTAWSYLAWYADPKNSISDVTDGTSGINPYRLSHLSDTSPWQASMGPLLAEQYLAVLRQSLSSPNVTLDLRIPGYRAYMAVLDEQIEQALKQTVSVEEALQNAATQWEQITDRLGRNSQKNHYRATMGLPQITP